MHRRLISTALLAGLILGATACAAKTEENPTATGTSSPSPAVATVDKATSCAALTKDMDALKLQTLALTTTMLEALNDPSKEAKVMEEARTMFRQMQMVGEKHLATAGDPELKAALATFTEQVKAQRAVLEAAGQDFDKFADAEDKGFEEAGDKLEALCSK